MGHRRAHFLVCGPYGPHVAYPDRRIGQRGSGHLVTVRRTWLTPLIMITILTGILGCVRVVWCTLIVGRIIITILRLAVNSVIETVLSGRVTSMSRIVSLTLTLVMSLGSRIIIMQSWWQRMGWFIDNMLFMHEFT